MTIAIIAVAWLTVLVGFVCLRLWVTRRHEKDYAARVDPANKSPRDTSYAEVTELNAREAEFGGRYSPSYSGMFGFELEQSYAGRGRGRY
jgi:hypothetical protein